MVYTVFCILFTCVIISRETSKLIVDVQSLWSARGSAACCESGITWKRAEFNHKLLWISNQKGSLPSPWWPFIREILCGDTGRTAKVECTTEVISNSWASHICPSSTPHSSWYSRVTSTGRQPEPSHPLAGEIEIRWLTCGGTVKDRGRNLWWHWLTER